MRNLWLTGALGVLLAATCQAEPTPVILISIDTLRADHLSAYGYSRIRTPSIDGFAQRGTLFTAIDSQIPLTLPSHTSLFTSTYPFANGVEENAQQLRPDAVTLASVLRSHGYKTAAFVGSVILDRRTGIGQGFDLYDSPFHLPEGAPENPYSTRVRRDGALVVRAARQWLEANSGQPVFAFVHLFDLHTPYSAAVGGGMVPQTAGYDAELQHVDQLLGRFQQALAASGWWDKALVVLLSDHGESLGEHGESSHGYFIYQSTLWVPLIIHWPNGAPNVPARYERPGGLVDVAPTILDFLGIAKPPSFAGQSLLKPVDHAVYSESVYTRDAFHWAPLRSLRAGILQYIDAPKPELYSLETDGGEHNNLYGTHAGSAQKLREQLANLLMQNAPRTTGGSAGGVSQNNQLLTSLGYLGMGSRAGRGGPAPDPKDRLAEYDRYEKGLTALYSGNPQSAIVIFRQLLNEDSGNTLARYYLGEAYLRARQADSAVREWNAALRLDPEYVPADEALGRLWMGREDYGRARGYFQQALAAAPGDFAALVGAAAAERHLGMAPEARQHLEKACAVEPDFAECLK
jgi:tetratricopeptide (TPR) repeat protein